MSVFRALYPSNSQFHLSSCLLQHANPTTTQSNPDQRGPQEDHTWGGREGGAHPRSNLKAATCPSKKARIAGIPNDEKAPTQAFFFCLAQNGACLLLQCVLYAVGRSLRISYIAAKYFREMVATNKKKPKLLDIATGID
ncbi:hypothetical protein B0T21DRAFT_366828, partial [Apiosordaria backusii]